MKSQRTIVALASLATAITAGIAAMTLDPGSSTTSQPPVDPVNLEPRDYPLASDWTFLDTQEPLGARARVQTRGIANEVELAWFEPARPSRVRLSQTLQFEFQPTAVATTHLNRLFVAGKSTKTGQTTVVGIHLRGP